MLKEFRIDLVADIRRYPSSRKFPHFNRPTLCERLASEVRSVLAELQLAANVEHVRDPLAIAQYGLLATPTLIIAGHIRASGGVPSREKMKKWLEEFC